MILTIYYKSDGYLSQKYQMSYKTFFMDDLIILKGLN